MRVRAKASLRPAALETQRAHAKPADREQQLRPVFAAAGAKLLSLHWGPEEAAIYGLEEASDSSAIDGVLFAVGASGLLDLQRIDDAFKIAHLALEGHLRHDPVRESAPPLIEPNELALR